MKTETRSQIVKIITKNGLARPAELSRTLKLSPQAIHRHLRSLTETGVLEARGSPPFTQYALSGVPNFLASFDWMKARAIVGNPPSQVSETRDTLTARLPHLKSFLKSGLSAALLPLVVSTAGEVGNNSFDHNLGQWRDGPGCWFEAQLTGKFLWLCVADRGQGVFRSLKRVDPALKNDQAALEAAFEKIISGRAPEQRGNGLKFVKKIFSDHPGRGLACASGSGRVHYGELGERCAALLGRSLVNAQGTITLMVWSLS